MEDFINLCQGGISVQEYPLKFVMLSKYASFFMSNPRDKISPFVTGVSDDLVEECWISMNNDNMDISCFMVHAKKVEESRLK